MVLLRLVSTVLTLGAEQWLTSRYGALGVLCLFCVGVGLKAHNTKCTCAGALIFVLLMIQA